ncbi:MAG: hypothetical protein WC344_03715 [Bacilli bacterium]|jgi:transposase
MKLTMDKKLRMVKEYLNDQAAMTKLAKKYEYDLAKIKYLIKLYQMHGEAPFTEQDKRVYTREEKLEAIKIVMAGLKSARQLALEKGLPSPHVIQDWVEKFKAGGPDSIQASRGRKAYRLHADRQRFLADKELKARLTFLEAENAYLKKAYSLIHEKGRRAKKKSS